LRVWRILCMRWPRLLVWLPWWVVLHDSTLCHINTHMPYDSTKVESCKILSGNPRYSCRGGMKDCLQPVLPLSCATMRIDRYRTGQRKGTRLACERANCFVAVSLPDGSHAQIGMRVNALVASTTCNFLSVWGVPRVGTGRLFRSATHPIASSTRAFLKRSRTRER